jgi:hypothetical protein
MDEAIDHFRTVGHTPGLVSAGQKLAQIDRAAGDYPSARARLVETALASRNAGTEIWGWQTIFTIGVIDIEQGAFAVGLRLIGATASRLPLTYLEPFEHAERDSSLVAARIALGEDTYDRVWAEGEAMTFEEAATYALVAGAVDAETESRMEDQQGST